MFKLLNIILEVAAASCLRLVLKCIIVIPKQACCVLFPLFTVMENLRL